MNNQNQNNPQTDNKLVSVELKPNAPCKNDLKNTNEVLLAILAIKKGILDQGGIALTRENTQQNYKYRSIYDIYRVVTPLMVENHLTCIGNIESSTVCQYLKKNGDITFKAVVLVRYTLISAIDGSTIELCKSGEANDNGDKAISKAQSNADKALYSQLFAIPIESDEEAKESLEKRNNQNYNQHSFNQNNGYRSNQQNNRNQNNQANRPVNSFQNNHQGNNQQHNQGNQGNQGNTQQQAQVTTKPKPDFNTPASLELKNYIDEQMKKDGVRLIEVLKKKGIYMQTIKDGVLRQVWDEYTQARKNSAEPIDFIQSAPPQHKHH